jgi:branched-chain amino acid transport system permease protein
MSKARHFYLGLAIIILAGVPLVVKSAYLIHILIMTGLYLALALGYNLSVGNVGTLSLAHAAFYGLGGYVAALLSIHFGVPFWVELVLAAIVSGGLAFLMGIPSFRLPDRAFSIGTLTFSLVTEQVVHNWVSLTRGPMCIVPVPRPKVNLSFLSNGEISSLTEYYYWVLAVALITFLFCSRLANSRIGRAWGAVRENVILARSMGINPVKYKMLALVIGAAIAGIAGASYGHYAQIICPTDLGWSVIVNLLIIVFVGGVGTVRGIVLGAIAFTVIPEVLRIAPTLRMLIYGILLLLAASYVPGGLNGVISKIFKRE